MNRLPLLILVVLPACVPAQSPSSSMSEEAERLTQERAALLSEMNIVNVRLAEDISHLARLQVALDHAEGPEKEELSGLVQRMEALVKASEVKLHSGRSDVLELDVRIREAESGR